MTQEELKIHLAGSDMKMRKRARAMCSSSNDGDDLWHDTVLKLLVTYSDGVENRNIDGLIHSTMMSVFLDSKRKFNPAKSPTELTHAEQEIVDREYSIYSRLQVYEIMTYLNTLNSTHRDIFLMNTFGMDNREIAARTDETLDNIKKIVYRVRSKVKKLFK